MEYNFSGYEWNFEVMNDHIEVFIESDSSWDYNYISCYLTLQELDQLASALSGLRLKLQHKLQERSG
jgi:hypothetical protein